MKIIVGLGNPGKKYEKTRHNAGFMAVDLLAKNHRLVWSENKKFNSLLAKHDDTLLVKPQAFMNLSGESVRKILDFYKIVSEDLAEVLIVIHDDLDIELGKYKISVGSRSAGHNGVQSIIDRLNTKNFRRIRVGIKTPELEKIPAEKFVLGRFGRIEMEKIRKIFDKLNEDACYTI